MKKRINKEIIIMAIISILFLMMSIVYADYLYNSSGVSFNNNNTTLTSTDVQSAIDELYNKCSNVPAVGTCPEGYNCTPLTKVTYNANGGSFSGNATNNVYYSFEDGDPVEKISKTSNLNDDGTRKSGTYGYMPQASSGITDTVTIEGAESLEVEITYQTYNSNYSYVYVRDKNGTNVSSKLYGAAKTTATVTVTGDTAKIYFYNSQSQSSSYSNYYGYYAKVKGKKNDKYIKNLEATKEEGEYKEPTNQNTQLEFAGWTENADGSGTLYRSEQEVMDSLDTDNRNITLYAYYYDPNIICKRATSLHTETCGHSSSSTGCRASGYLSGATIIYGQLGTIGSEPSAGDAFDCDVNNDGIYDTTTERFYYVSAYYDTQNLTFDNDYYVFIYYSNTYGGVARDNAVAWYSSNTVIYGPATAKSQLPTTSQWRDDLLKTTTRNILGSDGSGLGSNFSYSGYAARLLTYHEIKSACSTASSTVGSISSCNFILENSSYDNYGNTHRIWLETYYDGTHPWFVSSIDVNLNNNTGVTTSGGIGVRPVIEINKDLVSY